MKQKLIVIFSFLLFGFNSSFFSKQNLAPNKERLTNDSLDVKKERKGKRFGIALGYVYNPIKPDKAYPYDDFMRSNSDSFNLFKNAIHDFPVTPSLDFIYEARKRVTHSIGMTYRKVNRINNPGWDCADYSFSNFSINYQVARSFLIRNKKTDMSFIALKIYCGNKRLQDAASNCDVTGLSSNLLVIQDNDFSNLVLLQSSFGFIKELGHFQVMLGGTINLLAAIFGKTYYVVTNGNSATVRNESFRYSKILLIDKIISEKIFLQNIQLKLIYFF